MLIPRRKHKFAERRRREEEVIRRDSGVIAVIFSGLGPAARRPPALTSLSAPMSYYGDEELGIIGTE